MNRLQYLPLRRAGDCLDVAPLLYHGLNSDDPHVVIDFQGQAFTRRQLGREVAMLQAWLKAQGVSKGDHVAVMLNNSVRHMALIYAIVLSGLVWIPVNTKLRGAGLAYLTEHAEPRLLVLEDEFVSLFDGLPGHGQEQVTSQRLDTELADLAAGGEPVLFQVPCEVSDTLCLIYTSGTTGAPKGVIFTHRMMRIATEAALIVADIKAGDRAFLWEPLCHIGGAQMLMMPFLEPMTLLVVERFSASRFWQQWEEGRATHLHYLGGVLDILMQLPEGAKPAGARIPIAWGAGIAVNSWEPIRERLGCQLRECYGMTECSSFATLNTTGKPGSIGQPLPWITLSLLDEHDQPVKTGEAGQIVIRSELEGALLPGYWKNPEATAKTLRNGSLYTGDMARQDEEGNLFFIGRASDSMRVRGENVSAWEVERVFAEHPAIEMSAAMGVSSAIGEQEIFLFVKFNAGQIVAWEDLLAWARPRLASFQLPRYYMAIEAFSLTPSQRIQKHKLAPEMARAWDRQAQAQRDSPLAESRAG
ncbi:AMP-binding protein [Kerstersia gyiorum]|uniref:AMP-binding protein n=1 Tax=Kerstersia gyiorum TaxID=206506 RepID=UPI00214FDEF9|nr:AMP-binding protein [Kerstersia gyiorum]MCR4157797.1 AMP-binding protein [Kerstersia gyiorum]